MEMKTGEKIKTARKEKKMQQSTLAMCQVEHGTDDFGAEYKRTQNDFHLRFLTQENCVCVTLTRMPAAEARKLERKSKGFCGYDWMIKSIIIYGDIRYLGKEIPNDCY